MKDLLIIADLCADLLVTSQHKPEYGQQEKSIDDYSFALGGSAAIFSSQFKKLGGALTLIGSVGDDFTGRFILDKLGDLGIHTDGVVQHPNVKTALGIGLGYHDDRAMLTYLGSMANTCWQDVIDKGELDRPRHLHIASFFLLDQLIKDFAANLPVLKEAGWTVSLDTNWAPNGNWHDVLPILPYVDVFLPNENEALLISGCEWEEDLIDWAMQRPCITVIKKGKDGAMVIDKSGIVRMTVPSHLAEDLVIADTTGAGDNFDGGFIFRWLEGSPVEDCLELGIHCGTHSLRSLGGIDGQLTKLQYDILRTYNT